MSDQDWTPPYCAALLEDVACPKCEEESVHVRELSNYTDGEEVEAFCGECHALLVVYASVHIDFSDVSVSDEDAPADGAPR